MPSTPASSDAQAAQRAAERAELAELTLGLSAGRADAWEQLYRLTHLPLLRFLTARLRHTAPGGQTAESQLAEDLLQAIYVAAIESIRRFDAHKGTIDQWLIGIAKKKLLEANRQSARQRRQQPIDDQTPAAAADTASAAAVTALVDPEADLVSQTLDAIDPRYAEILRRKYILGESIEAIAFALKFKPATVGSWLHRGRDQFRAAYTRLSRAGDPDASHSTAAADPGAANA